MCLQPTSIVSTVAALAFAATASAHDFWLQPATFRPLAGSAVGIDLKVGHAGDMTTLPRNEKRLVKFVVRDGDGERPVPGAEGVAPAGLIRLPREGLAVVGYESNHSRSELDPLKFEGYLREVGLERIAEERAKRGATNVVEPEIFMRCPKALLVAQPAAATPGTAIPASGAPADASKPAPIVDRALGLRLELIAGANAASVKPGESLPFTLLYEGKPIGDVLVVVKDMVAGTEAARARSAADGTLSLTFPHAGRWLVTCVHMVKAPEGKDAVWESIWASSTIEVVG